MTGPVGLHKDEGKPDILAIPGDLLLETGRVFTWAERKYPNTPEGFPDFTNGIAVRRLLNSLLRHVLAWSVGESADQESGFSHLAHATANLSMIWWMVTRKPELDNREQFLVSELARH
jgi:hypothetical protein